MQKAKPTISTIIIVKNAARTLHTCLDSIKWSDEIIIIDSGSTDDTLQICREYTDKVYPMDWPGYGKQKNRALQLATKQWVLSIDADESLTSELIDEIQQIIQQETSTAGYRFLRKNLFCGKLMRHGNWKNDYVMRLFKREQGQFSDDALHERIILQGEIETVQHAMLHDTHPSLNNSLNKVNQFTSIAADMKRQKNKKTSLTKAIIHGAWAFFRGYVLRAGFLDGKYGFILAVLNAEESYYRYVKMLVNDPPLSSH